MPMRRLLRFSVPVAGSSNRRRPWPGRPSSTGGSLKPSTNPPSPIAGRGAPDPSRLLVTPLRSGRGHLFVVVGATESNADEALDAFLPAFRGRLPRRASGVLGRGMGSRGRSAAARGADARREAAEFSALSPHPAPRRSPAPKTRFPDWRGRSTQPSIASKRHTSANAGSSTTHPMSCALRSRSSRPR